ncbi:MAG: hypothetical protein QF470_05225 [Methylococcales bacterium]|nr:hypothetical protein [Methylococcales bacterium]
MDNALRVLSKKLLWCSVINKDADKMAVTSRRKFNDGPVVNSGFMVEPSVVLW